MKKCNKMTVKLCQNLFLYTETSMDLLEQQQAIEQARLLQRFKELRQMQLQQQELLMQQQKNQLDALKQEQKQVQNILAKQRQNKWGMIINKS